MTDALVVGGGPAGAAIALPIVLLLATTIGVMLGIQFIAALSERRSRHGSPAPGSMWC